MKYMLMLTTAIPEIFACIAVYLSMCIVNPRIWNADRTFPGSEMWSDTPQWLDDRNPVTYPSWLVFYFYLTVTASVADVA